MRYEHFVRAGFRYLVEVRLFSLLDPAVKMTLQQAGVALDERASRLTPGCRLFIFVFSSLDVNQTGLFFTLVKDALQPFF